MKIKTFLFSILFVFSCIVLQAQDRYKIVTSQNNEATLSVGYQNQQDTVKPQGKPQVTTVVKYNGISVKQKVGQIGLGVWDNSELFSVTIDNNSVLLVNNNQELYYPEIEWTFIDNTAVCHVTEDCTIFYNPLSLSLVLLLPDRAWQIYLN